ncbi:MAG: hypothetical protein M0Z41_00160 [Peptococcaceae bacterium]|nr:hypothetical protein [Peptococcaceae bacterium]
MTPIQDETEANSFFNWLKSPSGTDGPDLYQVTYGDRLPVGPSIALVEILSLCGWSETVRTELERWSVQVAVPGISMKRERRLDPAGKSLVLVLDDVNLLQDIDPQALMTLRAIFQELQMYHTRYGLVVTGPLGLFGEVRETAEPVTRFFEHLVLNAFDRKDTTDAVREPLVEVGAPFQVADDAVEWVYGQTKCHPYFLAFLMRDIVEETVKHGWPVIDAEVCIKCWSRIANHLETDKFNAELIAATPAEQELLLALAHGKEIQGNKRALFSRLMHTNLLVRTARGQYEVYHPLFAAFLRERTGN